MSRNEITKTNRIGCESNFKMIIWTLPIQYPHFSHVCLLNNVNWGQRYKWCSKSFTGHCLILSKMLLNLLENLVHRVEDSKSRHAHLSIYLYTVRHVLVSRNSESRDFQKVVSSHHLIWLYFSFLIYYFNPNTRNFKGMLSQN